MRSFRRGAGGVGGAGGTGGVGGVGGVRNCIIVFWDENSQKT